MDVEAKVAVLADAAKYDVSCASSGVDRRGARGKIGSSSRAGICHTWGSDGRCISLLKVLFSNACRYDCAYCVNRASAGGKRVSFTVDELADLAIAFYRRNYIEGLFLSSGVFAEPDTVMERLMQVAVKLRVEYGFNGYIHMKAIPGASRELIGAAGRWVDRMSVNIELPTEASLARLAPQKKKQDILGPMKWMRSGISRSRGELNDLRRSPLRRHAPPLFVPAGQSTQLIVGATPEEDKTILGLAESLYRRYEMKRVYYSAYVAVGGSGGGVDGEVGGGNGLLKVREHRLYQADWLMRFYGFSFSELLDDRQPSLDLSLDPKSEWALRNRELFPVELEKADYETLLRVPGIGVRSAQRLVAARREGSLGFELVSRLGVVMSRARYFITCGGRSLVMKDYGFPELRRRLGSGDERFGQLYLFDAVTGEL